MNQAFIKHFNLNQEELANAQSQLATGQTLLEYLFEKNWIDPKAYLEWAKDFYSLPILKQDFLDKNNQIENLLTRYKNVFPKNVIPFHEWDGVLYVMCLEPTPFQAPQTVQFILAPYELIQKYSPHSESKSTVAPQIDFSEKTEVTNPLFKTLKEEPASGPLESFSFDKLSLPGENTKPAATVPSTNFDSGGLIQLQADPESETVTEAHEGEEAPEGVSLDLNEPVGAPQGLNFPDFKPENPEFVSEKPVSALDLKSMKAAPTTPTVIPPQPPPIDSNPTITKPIIKEDSKTRIVDLNTLRNSPSAPPPTAKVTPGKAPPPTGTSVLQPIVETGKKYFVQTMVLSFSNNVLIPTAWDSSWIKQPHTQAAIDLSSPSIFRIVKETLMPYHGYVVPNPINDSFFQSWNKGQYPEHVTICPIYEGKILIGMFLGATSKEGAKKYQIHHIEELAQQALQLIKSHRAA